MSVSICADCLTRLRISSKATRATLALAATSTIPRTSSFHTSAAQYKSPLQKKKVIPGGKVKDVRSRKSQSARLKKKDRERPQLPPVGERRAQRRRIVLSNTNALAVEGLENWSKQNMLDDGYVGHVLGLDGVLLDQLRDSKAFKTTQNWSLFRRPATLIRQETVKIARDMEDVRIAENAKVVKHLATGERASGKSILMLQAMSMAYMNGWVVVNVPEAQDFINNTSSYTPLRSGEGDAPISSSAQLYIQPHLAQLLLTRAAYSNESVLSTLKLNHPPPKDLPLKKTATLKDLVLLGAEDHHHSHSAWQALWRELSEPGTNPRPPVLVAADGVDHWFGPSMYRGSEHEIIHAQQLTLVKHLTNLLFSADNTRSPFANGGMVFFSTSGSNRPSYPTFDLLVSQMRARANSIAPTSPSFPLPAPFSKPDPHVVELMPRAEGVNLMDVKGLSVLESRGYLEYFARSGLLHKKITEGLVGEYRGLSAGGVVGELARLGRRVIA